MARTDRNYGLWMACVRACVRACALCGHGPARVYIPFMSSLMNMFHACAHDVHSLVHTYTHSLVNTLHHHICVCRTEKGTARALYRNHHHYIQVVRQSVGWTLPVEKRKLQLYAVHAGTQPVCLSVT